LRIDYKGLVEEDEALMNFESPNDFIDLSTDSRFYGCGLDSCSQGSGDPKPLSMLSGKLKYHCPVLFSSLLTMEKDTLNSSKWLEKNTLHDTSLSIAGKGGFPLTVKNTKGFINPSSDQSVSPRDSPYLPNVCPLESLSFQ